MEWGSPPEVLTGAGPARLVPVVLIPVPVTFPLPRPQPRRDFAILGQSASGHGAGAGGSGGTGGGLASPRGSPGDVPGGVWARDGDDDTGAGARHQYEWKEVLPSNMQREHRVGAREVQCARRELGADGGGRRCDGVRQRS